MKKTKSISPWDYLRYALLVYAAFAAEFILFGQVPLNDYTPDQAVFHWMMSGIVFGGVALLLAWRSYSHLRFSILKLDKPSWKGIVISLALAVLCIRLNAAYLGALKIVAVFRQMGLLFIGFQLFYDISRMLLVFLILAFGQKFFEALLGRQTSIPWGGILLALTWGLVHILSKGSLSAGLGVALFSLAYGEIYLQLDKNALWTYGIITLAFLV